ncbi:hypothetical protein ACP4OV_022734 [Aristida adscensionis]
MATGCYGRRLSDLLREQQEPFLPLHGRRGRHGVAGNGGSPALGKIMQQLCGSKAVRWGLLAGCFSCGAARERDSFRRLPRAGGVRDRDVATELLCRAGEEEEEDVDGGRQHSPVSVLDLRSDEESSSPSLSNCKRRSAAAAAAAAFSSSLSQHPLTLFLDDAGEEDEEDDDEKPSVSGSSPPSDHASARVTFCNGGGKICGMEVERKEQASVSNWERIALDISRIPRLVELDLSASAREWRRLAVAGEEEEARRVGESIEAMIFEEVRWEAVRDIVVCFF